MNIIPSLLIYNPIEALVIIGIFGIIKHEETINKDVIGKCYLYGLINLVVQYLNELLFGSLTYIVSTLITTFIVNPLIFVMFTKYYFNNKNTFSAVAARIVYSIGSLAFILLLGQIDIVHVWTNGLTYYREFVENMIIQLPQLLVVVIIYHKALKDDLNG